MCAGGTAAVSTGTGAKAVNPAGSAYSTKRGMSTQERRSLDGQDAQKSKGKISLLRLVVLIVIFLAWILWGVLFAPTVIC